MSSWDDMDRRGFVPRHSGEGDDYQSRQSLAGRGGTAVSGSTKVLLYKLMLYNHVLKTGVVPKWQASSINATCESTLT